MKVLEKSFVSRARLTFKGALVVFLFAGFVVQCEAQTLSARNTSITFSLDGSNPGITDWTVNGGASQLNYQWFYYSVGSGPIFSIDNISSPSTPVIAGTSRSPTLTTTYANLGISVTTLFTLGSGTVGSPIATLGDGITINNPTATSQVYHFYQYSDFSGANQTANFTLGGVGYNLVQTSLVPASTISAQISSVSGGIGVLSEVQAGIYDGTQFGITNGAPTVTLNNTLSASGGQVDFAYEWDVTLAPSGQTGSSLTISELQTVPEPSSMALISSGMLVLGLLQRRWRRASC